MKKSLLALAAGVAMLAAMPVASSTVEARTAERSTMNRLDPDRITSKRVQRRDYGDRGMKYRWRNNDDRRWRRYSGWNRYDRRPVGWRNRGCVAVGPIWFCR